MNETLFFIHILLILGFVYGALRLGAPALIAVIALQAVLANVFVVKQMRLFGLSVTCSDVFAVGSILGLNLLQEHFGKEEARRAVRISFLCLVFFFVMSQIHLWYQPSSSDQTHGAFVQIFSHTFRIVAASIGAYWVVQRVDVLFFGWLKRLFSGKWLGMRLAISLGAMQLLDTALFSVLGLYGVVESLWDVMVMSYAIKCLVIGAMAVLWVKKDAVSI